MEDLIEAIEISDEDSHKVIDIQNAIPASIAEVLGEPEEENGGGEIAIKSQYTQADLR
jgi:hypothetical protein